MQKVLRGNTSVNFSENRFFFCLKFSLNILEYKAKGFIHENFFFCWISRFSWGVSGVSHTATCAIKGGNRFRWLKKWNFFLCHKLLVELSKNMFPKFQWKISIRSGVTIVFKWMSPLTCWTARYVFYAFFSKRLFWDFRTL